MSQILRATFIQCLQKLGAFSPKEEVVTPQNPAPPQPSRRATATTSNKFRVEKRASKKRAGAARTLERNIKDRQRTLAELEAVIAEQRQTIIVLENKLELARHQVGRIYVERWIAILETQQIPFATERRNFVTPDNDILETKIDKLWHLILDVGAGGATRWERSRHKRLLKSPFYDHVQRTGYKDDQMVSPKIVLTAAVAFYLFQEVVLEPLYVILGRWVLRRELDDGVQELVSRWQSCEDDLEQVIRSSASFGRELWKDISPLRPDDSDPPPEELLRCFEEAIRLSLALYCRHTHYALEIPEKFDCNDQNHLLDHRVDDDREALHGLPVVVVRPGIWKIDKDNKSRLILKPILYAATKRTIA